MNNTTFEQFESEHDEIVTENYNILTANYPYDEDRELNAVDGYGSEEDYQQHFLDEAEDMFINYLMYDEDDLDFEDFLCNN